MSRIDAPRLAAYDVLRAVREDDAYANLVLPQLLRERRIEGRDAAFVTELVGRYDRFVLMRRISA